MRHVDRWLGVVLLSLGLATSLPACRGTDGGNEDVDDEPAEGVSVAVKPLEVGYTRSNAVRVEITLTNHSAMEQRLPRWQTPVDGLSADLLVVTRDGVPVPYIGAGSARPAVEPELVLAAGESVSATVDVAQAYDLSVAGDYSIEYGALASSGVRRSLSSEATLQIR